MHGLFPRGIEASLQVEMLLTLQILQFCGMSFNSEDSSLLGVLPAHSAPPNRGAGDGSALRSLGMGDGCLTKVTAFPICILQPCPSVNAESSS